MWYRSNMYSRQITVLNQRKKKNGYLNIIQPTHMQNNYAHSVWWTMATPMNKNPSSTTLLNYSFVEHTTCLLSALPLLDIVLEFIEVLAPGFPCLVIDTNSWEIESKVCSQKYQKPSHNGDNGRKRSRVVHINRLHYRVQPDITAPPPPPPR